MSLLLLEDVGGTFLLTEGDGFLALESHRQIIPASESDAAQALTNQSAVTLIPIDEVDSAQEFFWGAGAAQPLSYGKRPALADLMELDEALALIITHVQSRTITPVAETDAAQTLTKTTGAVIFKTITPVRESG